MIWARCFILAIALVGCGRLRHDHAVSGGLGRPHTRNVRIVMDTSPEPPVQVEIGIVRAIGEGNRANLESVIEGLQLEAQEVGADAVVRVRIDQGANSVSGVGVAGVLAD